MIDLLGKGEMANSSQQIEDGREKKEPNHKNINGE